MTGFRLPDLGEGLREAEVVVWHVGPGDHVVADQPLVSVETDKAVVEIPSPRSGHVARLLAEPGDIIAVGDVLIEFADEARPDAGAIVGELPSSDDRTAPLATPAVRSRARQLAVDLTTVTPTGPGGTVSIEDVESAASSVPEESAVSTATTRIEPLRGVRRAMAANMARARAEVAPATVTDDADVGGWARGQDVTVRLVRAIAVAVAAEPALNMSYLGRDVGRRHNEAVHVGIAVDTDDGLFVPVLRDVANRSPVDLRSGLDSLKADLGARTVPAEQLRGQTITLSNFGTFGGRHGALVVVPPQVAIVGAGRIHMSVVAHDGEPAVRPVLPLSLTFDHRVVMGGEAARFLTTLIADLELSS